MPITTLSHNGGKLWWAFWNYQTTMFNYHAHLEATHSFASPWYEWPFDIRPIWYFAQDNWNGYSTISSFGNPLLWWGCLPALAAAAYLWWKERPRWAAVVLAGFGSVYLPWVLVPRLTFIYHYFTAVPFLVVALCGVFSLLYEKGPFARRLTFPGDWSARAPRCCWRPLPQGACCCSRCTSRCSPAPPPPGNMPTPWSCLIAGISVEKEPRESKYKVFGPLVCRIGRLLGNVPLGRNSPFSKGLRGWGRAPRSCPYWAAARKRAKEKRRQPSVACAFPARGSAAAVNSRPWQLAAARAHRTVRAPARRGLLVGLPPSRPRKEKRNRTHRLTQPRPCTIMGTILTRGGLPYALQRV